jgi:serine/threonine protein kinase
MLTTATEAVQGLRQSWNLVKKLGEGDAGEVYLVESIRDHRLAILKRPRKGTFFSDALRQANQIKTEGSILSGLPKSISPVQDIRLNIPTLIDQNKSEHDLGEKTFIIIEQARGLNLKQLSQVIRFGPASVESSGINPEYSSLIQLWSQFTEFPAPFLIRILLAVLSLLENIHIAKVRSGHGYKSGVIWNDVKPEHLYWDPFELCLTVIDWGNSQFLESSNISKDRHYSALDDFRQFIQEMGSFVSEANPDLYARLQWPENSASLDLMEHAIMPLKDKLVSLQAMDAESLHTLRKQEEELYSSFKPGLNHIAEFIQLQQRLSAYGETADTFTANNFMLKAAYQMASESRLTEFHQICEIAAQIPCASPDKWKLLDEISTLSGQQVDGDQPARAALTNALVAGVAGDWISALWELFIQLAKSPRPDWWEKISQEIRIIGLGLEPDSIPPYTILARLYYTLRAEITRKGEQRLSLNTNGKTTNNTALGAFHWQAGEDLLATFREEILNKWKEIEPNPPNSGIAYTEIDSLAEGMEELLPGSIAQLDKALAQPKAQVELVLNAWEQKDFELARRGLRSILLWDPDRARLFTAEEAIGKAPQWLARVRKGAANQEPFYDFLTSVELDGRSLRNQVGPAKWLDQALEAFKRLRRGTRSVDLMIEYPEILNELPWLNEYQSREILSFPHTHPLRLERDTDVQSLSAINSGVVEGKFGPNQVMVLGEPLDTWLPEAKGSSARVFTGLMGKEGQRSQSLAFKIMRPDQVDYALPLFIEEIQILTLLSDVPGITPLMECGFIKLDDGQTLPSDDSHASAEHLSGQVIHYGVEQAQNYLASMNRQLSAGWLPYLALLKRNPEYNLLHYCDASHTHGWFLSLKDSIILALQICDTLQFAHDRNIVYRDHKILHYFWDANMHGVTMIDWNVAKRQPQGLSNEERQFDLVQFGARCLHHIFTGRPAQGSLPLGPNSPEDIDKASNHYPVNWTYDDERLPNQLRNILEMTLNQGYTQVHDLRQDLLAIFQQLPGTAKN